MPEKQKLQNQENNFVFEEKKLYLQNQYEELMYSIVTYKVRDYY